MVALRIGALRRVRSERLALGLFLALADAERGDGLRAGEPRGEVRHAGHGGYRLPDRVSDTIKCEPTRCEEQDCSFVLSRSDTPVPHRPEEHPWPPIRACSTGTPASTPGTSAASPPGTEGSLGVAQSSGLITCAA